VNDAFQWETSGRYRFRLLVTEDGVVLYELNRRDFCQGYCVYDGRHFYLGTNQHVFGPNHPPNLPRAAKAENKSFVYVTKRSKYKVISNKKSKYAPASISIYAYRYDCLISHPSTII
jgi:hypothetical protein